LPNSATLYVSMRAKGAAEFFASVSRAAAEIESIGRDGAFEQRIAGEWGDGGRVEIVFNNDDMERPEMDGRTIVDFD
jgi:hypothetical protein